MDLKLGIYRHYKGHTFEVVGVGRHHHTLEELVVYKTLEDSDAFSSGTLWVRSKTVFFEALLVDGVEVPHFKYIGK
jgi:hypothetical protein